MRVVAPAGAVLLLLFVASAAPASAQQHQPLPIAAADLRLFYSGLGQDPVTATDLDDA